MEYGARSTCALKIVSSAEQCVCRLRVCAGFTERGPESPWLQAGINGLSLGRRRRYRHVAVPPLVRENRPICTFHLTNQIVFAVATVHRSCEEKRLPTFAVVCSDGVRLS